MIVDHEIDVAFSVYIDSKSVWFIGHEHSDHQYYIALNFV